MKTVVLSGGHLSPAVAITEEFQRHGYRVVIFGRPYAFSEATDKPSLEKEIFKEMGVDFRPVEASRMPHSAFNYPKYIARTWQSKTAIEKSLREIKPEVLISFGGYVSIPLLAAASSLKLPVFLHEQTTTAGLSNKLFCFFAQKVFISWPETLKTFPKLVQNKVILTGNPVRQEVLSLVGKINLKKNKDLTIYITGGSTGAHAINTVVASSLEKLLKKYTVIHQVGDSHYNDFELLQEKQKNLPKELQKKYRLIRYATLSEIKKIYAETDILVGRSGANTVTEVAILGIPSIFIPLPLAQYNEQELLAKKLESNGIATILPQKELSEDSLLNALDIVTKNYETYVKYGQLYRESEEITRHKDANRDIADHIELWRNQRGNSTS